MKRKSAPDEDSLSGHVQNPNRKERFVRNFEHVDAKYRRISGIASSCIRHYQSNCTINQDIIPVEEPHLSVSRPFVLRLHQIRPFTSKLAEALQHIDAISCRVESKYQILSNDGGTRWFIAVPVQDTNNKLLAITRAVDDVLGAFHQLKYYKNPIFHISVASMLPPAGASLPATTLHRVEVLLSTSRKGLEALRMWDHSNDDDEDDSESESEISAEWDYAVVASSSSAASVSGSVSASIAKEISEIKNMGIQGMLCGYSSGSDSENGRVVEIENTPTADKCTNHKNKIRENNSSQGKTGSVSCTNLSSMQATVVSRILTFTAVICKIGNRTLRLELSTDPTSHTSLAPSIHSNCMRQFVEL